MKIENRILAGQKRLAQNIQSDEIRDLQPGLLYPAELTFRIEGQPSPVSSVS